MGGPQAAHGPGRSTPGRGITARYGTPRRAPQVQTERYRGWRRKGDPRTGSRCPITTRYVGGQGAALLPAGPTSGGARLPGGARAGGAPEPWGRGEAERCPVQM